MLVREFLQKVIYGTEVIIVFYRSDKSVREKLSLDPYNFLEINQDILDSEISFISTSDFDRIVIHLLDNDLVSFDFDF